MTEKPHAYPQYIDATGKLTQEGIYWVKRRWNQTFVADDESLLIDDVESVLFEDCELDWDLWERVGANIDGASVQAALVAAGAKIDPEHPGSVLARERDGLGACTGSDYIESVDWLVEDLIPERSISLVIADPFQMKTWWAMSLLTAAARKDSHWLGRELRTDCLLSRYPDHRKRRAVWVAFEGADVMARRFAMLGDKGSVYQVGLPPLTLSDPRFWRELAKLNPGIVAIDSLSRGNPGVDEKDSRFAEPLARAEAFARDHGTTFIFVGHSPKDSGSGLVDLVRGTSAVAAAADMVFNLEGVRFTSSDPTEHRSRVTCVKHRSLAQAPAPFVFKLTDGRGIELHDESRQKSKPSGDTSDVEVVFAAIESSPGTNVANLARDLRMRDADVRAAPDALVSDGRIRIDGAGPKTQLFVAA